MLLKSLSRCVTCADEPRSSRERCMFAQSLLDSHSRGYQALRLRFRAYAFFSTNVIDWCKLSYAVSPLSSTWRSAAVSGRRSYCNISANRKFYREAGVCTQSFTLVTHQQCADTNVLRC